MIETLINNTWPLMVTQDRHEFHRVRPGWEKERLVTCAEMMTPGMTVYDIGAECGDFTSLYGTWVGSTGRVIPVEPSSPYWPSIRAHWEANNLPRLSGFFIGFASDHDDLNPPKQRDASAFDPHHLSGWPHCSVGQIMPDFGFRHLAQQADDTRQLTIDTMVDNFGKPDAIVMDIEGAEWHALQGCQRVLMNDRPIMWVSIHPATMLDWYGKTVEDISNYMTDLDYVGAMLGEDSEQYWLFVPK